MADDMSVSNSSASSAARQAAERASDPPKAEAKAEAKPDPAQGMKARENVVESATRTNEARGAAGARSLGGAAGGAAVGGPAGTAGGSTSKDASKTTNTQEARAAALQKQIDTAADKLAANSPTARALLDKFRAEGGRFEDGGSAGYFKDGKPPVIGIMTQSNGKATSETDRQQTIAHELGHFDYARSTPPGVVAPSYDNGGRTDAQIEARRERDYVVKNTNRHLGDEAHATEVNGKIRDEVKAKTGQDIGVAGVAPGAPVPSKDALVDQYGRLTPSGSPGKNYRDYYGQPYLDAYKKYYVPGGPGNL